MSFGEEPNEEREGGYVEVTKTTVKTGDEVITEREVRLTEKGRERVKELGYVDFDTLALLAYD